MDQRLGGLWEGVGHTVAETLTQTGPEKHNTTLSEPSTQPTTHVIVAALLKYGNIQ